MCRDYLRNRFAFRAAQLRATSAVTGRDASMHEMDLKKCCHQKQLNTKTCFGLGKSLINSYLLHFLYNVNNIIA